MLVGDALRDAVRSGKLVAPQRLHSYLSALAPRQHTDADRLIEEFGSLLGAAEAGGNHG
jgi:hypothetical protein